MFSLLALVLVSTSELIVCAQCPLSTLGAAVAVAVSGDTIRVQSGVYREGALVITKSLTLLGEGGPVIDGEGKVQVLTLRAPNITVKGFVIRNSGASYTQDIAGIKADRARRCRIEDNRLENTFFGIYLAKSHDCRVARNTVTGRAQTETFSGNGIHSWGSEGVEIAGNVVRGHRDGIYLEFLRQGIVADNRCEKNLRYGLHFMYSQDSRYLRNVFRDNGAGVAVMYSGHIEMRGNTFADNWGAASYGLLLKDIDDSTMTENVIRNNTIGLSVDGANRIDIARNDFADNGWGVRLMANSMGIVFLNNNFTGNTFDVSTNSSLTFNSFIQNYWSAYRGFDLDRNGFGDVPYRPVSLIAVWLERFPELLVLLHSPLVRLLDLSERLLPALTPQTLADFRPSLYRIAWSKSAN